MAEHAIVAEGLVKRFGGVVALDDVGYAVDPGTVLGLLGPNGAGKTTAIRIMTTLLRPDAGRATVLGRDVVRDAAEVRRLIGLAGQSAAVDPNLTGRENLRLIGRLNQLPRSTFVARADDLLERFGLARAASRPVRGYSGGMRRRLDVAAALVAAPPVLFLDEPTTGLDPQSRNELWTTIRKLVADGTTVVLTTQYLEEADELADRVTVVDHGKVIADDTPAALKSRLGTVIELAMPDEAAAVRAELVLHAQPDSQVDRTGTTVRLTSHDGSRLLISALHALDRDSMLPTAVQVREPSLDEAFLSLTGDRTEDGS
ncbi:MAG TPA: ATP-binding cassette domain-containing protein [Jatrophihabitans sp.]|jgi:daunorubicin resistance ABC transporter ATP-binding subunit